MAIEDRIRLPTLNLIHRRPRLLNVLTEFIETGKHLITIYAPGGYGKSILLADFAQTTDLPVCWCSLEPVDRDPTAFLTLLGHSITDRFHEIEAGGLLQLVEQGDTQNSVRRVAELLGEVGPHLIIIDDYHKAVSAGMTLALNRLVEQLPEESTIIVAARGDMTLETDQVIDLLVSDRAGGLSEEELRFTAQELQLMMRKRFGRRMDLRSAAEVAAATDGNIAQILLTGHLMHAEQLIGRLRQRLGDDRGIIYGYLAEEVFGKQTEELKDFMLQTAMLPDMTAELCNALLGIEDGQGYIEELVRKDLFIAQIGAGFRYHDLFAEFLQSRLREDEGEYRWVTTRAAGLLAERERYEEAIPLYLSVAAWDEVMQLLEEQGGSLFDNGRALTLHGWLVQIPEVEIAGHPWLLLLFGELLIYEMGESEQALAFYQLAEEKFNQQNDPIGLAEVYVYRAAAFRLTGRASESLELATMGLEQLEILEADRRIIALALKQCGRAHRITGNIIEALSDLRRALEIYEMLSDTYNIGSCHHEIGMYLVAQGNISGADYHYRQALRIWETLGNANDLVNTLNSLGVMLYLIGRYDEALEYLKESLDISLQIGSARRAAFAQASIADVYLDLHKYDEAQEAYDRSTDHAQKAGVQALVVYNLVKVGQCSFEQSNLDQALSLAGRARDIATETGLGFEKGLAITLQAKVYVGRAEYSASFDLFAQALDCFAANDVLEQVKVRLWWGYSQLLDFRAATAQEQLREAIRLALGMGELIQGLGPTVAETQYLLLHFLHRAETSDGTRENIELLLEQSQTKLDLISPRLEVFAFGTPYLAVAGEYKLFNQRGGVRRLPEFLLYLIAAAQKGGCSWTEVTLALWPELNRDRSSANFHQTLKRLRGILGNPDYILVQDDYYRINPDYLEWCDILAFEQLFGRATELPPHEAIAIQLELISLYRGEFLAGFDLGEWGTAFRTATEAKFLQVVALAGEYLLQNGEAQEALTVINRGLAEDYFREELHRSALKGYAQLGLYDHLTSHYDQLGQIFAQEFDAPPDTATQQLYEQLVAKR